MDELPPQRWWETACVVRGSLAIAAAVLVAGCQGEPEDHSLADAMNAVIVLYAAAIFLVIGTVVWLIRRTR